jgi:DNA-binding transcriptional MerR regulator
MGHLGDAGADGASPGGRGQAPEDVRLHEPSRGAADGQRGRLEHVSERLGRRIGAYVRRVAGGDEPLGPGPAMRIPRKLYRTSEIADHFDITRQTVHNYATMGLITEETRTDGGQRLFDESVFIRLFQIQRMKRTHRLHEIREILETQGLAALAPAAPSLTVETEAYLVSARGEAARAGAAVATEPSAEAGASRPSPSASDQPGPSSTMDPEGDHVGPDVAARASHAGETRRREEPAK